jgi:hypothetical protein
MARPADGLKPRPEAARLEGRNLLTERRSKLRIADPKVRPQIGYALGPQI